nr:phosphatase PAP2 family protein [uncultured Cohaesibacter sp.]
MLETFKKDIAAYPLFWMSIAILLISATFLIVPELDLWVSGLFYDHKQGFWLKALYFPARLRKLGLFLPRMAILLLLAFIVARLFWPPLKRLASLSTVLFLFVSTLIGPGLIINGILKSFWGRARPIQTEQFGGDWPFSPIWVIKDHCQGNCSFVSGEASMAFWLLGLVLLLPLGWRMGGGWLIATLGLFISMNRIAFGGHYLSDILLAWALTGWTMLALLLLWQRLDWFGTRAIQLEKSWDTAGKHLKNRSQALWQILRQ